MKKYSFYLIFIFFRVISFECQVEELSPFELVCAERFDIMAKYIYARHWQMGIITGWPLEVYKEHLRVWGNFHEAQPLPSFPHFNCSKDYPIKNSFQDYLETFNTCLHSISKEGFNSKKSILPIDINGVLMDGSHRLTAALVYGQWVTAKVFNTRTAKYDSYYFKQRTEYVKNGLDEHYLDAMALEYVGLKGNTYIAMVFPCITEKMDQIKDILNLYGKIVYEKNVELKNQGFLNLLHLIYEGEPWIGSYMNNFKGIRSVLKRYFPNNIGSLKVFLFECESLEHVKETKQKVRSLFNVGNCAMHINDRYQETVKIAEALFVENSIHWLNNARLKYFAKFEQYLKNYKNWIEKNNIYSEFLCIDTGAVLSAYGLRDCSDLDVIAFDSSLNNNDISLNSHENEMKYHNYTKEEIIFDPHYHFYYRGLKFAALNVVKAMKLNRYEEKDKKDIDLINGFI